MWVSYPSKPKKHRDTEFDGHVIGHQYYRLAGSSMDKDQLKVGLEAKFELSRIVFWHDPENTFFDDVNSLDLAGVTTILMQEISYLEIKKRIELDEPESCFLLYCPYEIPSPEDDWLLDIRCYSESFYADKSSMILNELGLTVMSLRNHLKNREIFLANKQRIAALKKFVVEHETEESLDLKMISVLLKADTSTLQDVMLCLLDQYASELQIGSEEPSVMDQIRKFGLDGTLASLCRQHYGYYPGEFTIQDFVLKLFCSELNKNVRTDDMTWLGDNLLKTSSGTAAAIALMVSWRDSKKYSDAYAIVAKDIEDKLEIVDRLRTLQPNDMLDCETFEAIEKHIIKSLVSSLLDFSRPLDVTHFSSILSRRASSYWTLRYSGYSDIYAALAHAHKLISLRRKYESGFHYGSVKEMYANYTSNLYQFDQYYRLFHEKVLSLQMKGADVLRQLSEEIEKLYSNWFLFEFGIAWDNLLDQENFLENKSVDGFNSQSDFYAEINKALLSGGRSRRVFVIISDALRYEVGQELASKINEDKRFKVNISSQLGCTPSYTALGKATLLPHQEISYRSNDASVLVDGQLVSGIENRRKILTSVKGTAFDYKDVLKWRNYDGREAVKDYQLVYIYHDTIDSIGDTASSEQDTFYACRKAVDELTDLVGRIINRLNGNRIFISSDHGFLYQQKPLDSNDKTELEIKPDGAIVKKKRYILGQNLPDIDSCWKGTVARCSDSDVPMEFLVPKGTQRFHFVGGAKFVHGGLMPQEICVPVLDIRSLLKKQSETDSKKTVGVVPQSSPIKMVNNIEKLQFIQTDAVDEKHIPRKLDIFIADANGTEVSSVETVVFDSSSDSMADRTKDLRIKLKGAGFDRVAEYSLVMRNSDTKTIYAKHTVYIDLAFQDDFF